MCKGCGTNKASAWRGTKDGPFWCKLADCMREGGYLPPLLPGRKRHRTAGAEDGEEGEGEEHQEEGSIADVIAPIYTRSNASLVSGKQLTTRLSRAYPRNLSRSPRVLTTLLPAC